MYSNIHTASKTDKQMVVIYSQNWWKCCPIKIHIRRTCIVLKWRSQVKIMFFIRWCLTSWQIFMKIKCHRNFKFSGWRK